MTSLLSREEQKFIRTAGSIVKECMHIIEKCLKAGVSTKALEDEADRFIASKKARPAFRGYKGFPSSICTSRNEVVVHGIPNENEIVKSGDIVSIDIGVDYKGYCADAAQTFAVGSIPHETRTLISITREALHRGIEKARAGNHVQDISWAIQSFVESNGFNVVRAFVGHGIGRHIHEPPEIPNFGRPHKGALLEDGMIIAIEPMVNAGSNEVEVLDDGWTAVTKDNRVSAHFEHTVIIGRGTAEIVT
jgi:methionyl aminopeptidase